MRGILCGACASPVSGDMKRRTAIAVMTLVIVDAASPLLRFTWPCFEVWSEEPDSASSLPLRFVCPTPRVSGAEVSERRERFGGRCTRLLGGADALESSFLLDQRE